MTEHDDDLEERAANLSNDITDAAQALVIDCGWSVEDVIDHVRAVLGG